MHRMAYWISGSSSGHDTSSGKVNTFATETAAEVAAAADVIASLCESGYMRANLYDSAAT